MKKILLILAFLLLIICLVFWFFKSFFIIKINNENKFPGKHLIYNENNIRIYAGIIGELSNKKELYEFAINDLNNKLDFIKDYFPKNVSDLFLKNSVHEIVFIEENYYKVITEKDDFRMESINGIKITLFNQKEKIIYDTYRPCVINENLKVGNPEDFYGTDIHEMVEEILLVFFKEVKAQEKSQIKNDSSRNRYDPLMRWINDGLATSLGGKYLLKKQKKQKIGSKNDDLIKKGKSDFENVNFLEWSYPLFFKDNSIPKEVNKVLTDDYRKYSASKKFFDQIIKIKGKSFIVDLTQYIFDNIKTIKSEDVLLFIEKEIGREELEKLVGKDYIKRVKKYREDLFDDVFRYLKENNLQEYYTVMQERYYVPETIVEKYGL